LIIVVVAVEEVVDVGGRRFFREEIPDGLGIPLLLGELQADVPRLQERFSRGEQIETVRVTVPERVDVARIETPLHQDRGEGAEASRPTDILNDRREQALQTGDHQGRRVSKGVQLVRVRKAVANTELPRLPVAGQY